MRLRWVCYIVKFVAQGHTKVRRSPGVSPSSSQHDLQTGSSMSTSGSSDPTDILSSTREPEHPASNAVADKVSSFVSMATLNYIQLDSSAACPNIFIARL